MQRMSEFMFEIPDLVNVHTASKKTNSLLMVCWDCSSSIILSALRAALMYRIKVVLVFETLMPAWIRGAQRQRFPFRLMDRLMDRLMEFGVVWLREVDNGPSCEKRNIFS
jgi:hypothetical protein